MTYNRISLFVVLVGLSCSPQRIVAEEPARPTAPPPCAPSEKCVQPTKPTSIGTAQATPTNPEPKADKKKKIPAKSDKTEKQTSPTKTAEGQSNPSNVAQPTPEKSKTGIVTNQPSGPKKTANLDCPGPNGPLTSSPCGSPGLSSADATASQAKPLDMEAGPEKPSLDLLRRKAAGATTNDAAADTNTDSMSKDELFGLPNATTDTTVEAISKDDLFDLPDAKGSPKGESRRIEWRGFVQNETAYTYDDPAHWSRAVVRTQVRAQDGGSGLKWKATVRMDVDPVYYGTNFYPQPVREDQHLDFFLRETYVDTSVGGLDLRLGKQNIIWGEMVGLFFADVVSARDQRDFILPDFEIIRIPQWAARAEYFGEKFHAEVIWLPYPEMDNIGKPGAEFFPFQIPAPSGFSQQFNDVRRPDNNLKNSNYGARASTLRNGWDWSAFYYRSTDVSPTFYRDVTLSPTPRLVYTPRHDRIWQAGGTLAKDFGSFVAKAETIYASGRQFNVTRLTQPTGVVPQDTLDYVLGLDFTLPGETRLNLQYFERLFFHHDPDLLQNRRESGVSLLLSGKIGANLAPEFLIIQSVNRNDSLMRPKIAWIAERNWRVTFGVDIFTGPITGLFGRFQDRDRAYIESRYDF